MALCSGSASFGITDYFQLSILRASCGPNKTETKKGFGIAWSRNDIPVQSHTHYLYDASYELIQGLQWLFRCLVPARTVRTKVTRSNKVPPPHLPQDVDKAFDIGLL